LGYIFVADSMGLMLISLMYLALKATKFGEIMQNDGITQFKIIKGHRFWYLSKGRM